MKKSLSLAIVLAATAFLSVSAQAQEPASPAANAPATPSVTTPGASMKNASPAEITYAKDRAECDALASAPSTEGAAPSDATREAAIKKCLGAKGHAETEISAEEAKRSAATAPSAAHPASTAH